ncbi:unnamed protein product, partial [Meganyctiphanes norvegica]
SHQWPRKDLLQSCPYVPSIVLCCVMPNLAQAVQKLLCSLFTLNIFFVFTDGVRVIAALHLSATIKPNFGNIYFICMFLNLKGNFDLFTSSNSQYCVHVSIYATGSDLNAVNW